MKRSIASALKATIQDETAAFQSRLAKADAALSDAALSDAALAKTKSPTATPSARTARSAPKTRKETRPLRVVRDSFTMPESDYARISAARERALKNGVAVSKAEILRAGLLAISRLKDEQLTELLGTLDKVKVGRPNTI